MYLDFCFDFGQKFKLNLLLDRKYLLFVQFIISIVIIKKETNDDFVYK